ncbi:MAG: hypothetical protein QOG59_3469, partial [Solirubrobacteraceae bacterium]|nr:hypothetical protein [Solirubrobacteraceae bacterium]
MADARVRIEVADHVAVVTLTRPDKHNALDVPMFDAILAATERLSTEPEVRAVVLHGEGPSFCSGLDIASFLASGDGVSGFGILQTREGPRQANLAQRVATDWL